MYKVAFMAWGKHSIDLSLIPFVDNPMNMESGDGYTHETVVALIMKDILEKAVEPYEFIQVENSYQGYKYCLENDINVLNVSYTEMAGIALDQSFQRLIDTGCKIIVAAGNSHDRGESLVARRDNFVTAVASVNGKGEHLDYSSWGNGHVDIACVGLHHIGGRWRTGTSFAAPVASALTALYDVKFHKKHGRYMTQKEQYAWYRQACIDIEEPGKDLKTGYGWLTEKAVEGEVLDMSDVFEDDNGKWYEEDANYLANKGIIKGYPDGTLKGDSPITRAEAIAMNANQYRQIEQKLREINTKLDKLMG